MESPVKPDGRLSVASDIGAIEVLCSSQPVIPSGKLQSSQRASRPSLIAGFDDGKRQESYSSFAGARRPSRVSRKYDEGVDLPVAVRKLRLLGNESVLGDVFDPAPVSSFLEGEPDEWLVYDSLFDRIGVNSEETMLRAQTTVFLQLERHRTELGPKNLTAVDAQFDLALLLKATGNITDAQENFNSIIIEYDKQLGHEHPKTIRTAKLVALCECSRGHLSEAQAMLEKIRFVMEKVHGAGGAESLALLNHIANIEKMRKLSPESEEHYKQALEGWENLGMKYDVQRLNVLNNLGVLQNLRNHSKRACISHKYAFDGLKQVVGPEHPLTLKALHDLGVASIGAQRQEDADVYLHVCHESRIKLLGASHLDTLATAHMYAMAMKLDPKNKADLAENMATADAYLAIAYDGRCKELGATHPSTLQSLCERARLAVSRNSFMEAETLYQHCVEGHGEAFGDMHMETLRYRHEWAVVLLHNNKRKLAIEQLEITLNGKSKMFSPEHHELLSTKDLLETLVPPKKKKSRLCCM